MAVGLYVSNRPRTLTVSASCVAAAAATPPAPTPPKLELKPLKWKEALASVMIGLIIRFAIPCPAGVTMQAWSLLSIFIATIAGIVLNPLPVGAWAFFGLTATVFTKTLTFQQAFGAFTNDVIWLIVIIFFIARGFVKTGLGDRCGYLFAKVRSRGFRIANPSSQPLCSATPLITSVSIPTPTLSPTLTFLVPPRQQDSLFNTLSCFPAPSTAPIIVPISKQCTVQ